MGWKRILAAGLGGAATLALSACASQTHLTINADDTWDLDAHITQVRIDTTPTCSEIVPGLSQFSNLAEVTIEDKSTERISDCRIVIKNQPIQAAAKPFATIKHYGGDYRVELEASPDLRTVAKELSSVKLSITFPGPVLSVEPQEGAQVDGHTVTWTDYTPLMKGFRVSGQDHPGATFTEKLLILFALFVVFMVVLVATSREHPHVVKARAWLQRARKRLWVRVQALGHTLYVFADRSEKWMREQAGIDSKAHGRRARGKKREPRTPGAGATTSLPGKQTVEAKRSTEQSVGTPSTKPGEPEGKRAGDAERR